MIDECTLNGTIAEMFDNISFPEKPEGLYEPLRYMIKIGGKRIRPRLCLLTYSLFKDKLDESILEPAAALEVFHTFTLIHDDIMDKSPMRRGCPTVWYKWDDDTAILSGDVMSIDSYRRMAKAPAALLPAALDLFNTTAAQVCEGQQYDMDFESVPEVPMADYMKMIGLKTGVLIACAAKMGAIIGEAPAEMADSLYRFGYEIGLAFQVADDFLDTYGDAKVFGKPIGGDIVNNKKSWLLTKALETIADKQTLFSAMEMPVDTDEQKALKISTVRGIYDTLGIGEMAKAEVRRLNGRALEAIAGLKDSNPDGYAMMRSYADALVGRAK